MRNRAATWHMRAYRLAQRSGKKQEVAWALLGYGAMMRDAGNFEEARRFIERAARRAVGLRKRKEAGMAFHDLYVIAVEQERYTLAIKHARNAFHRYPIRNPAIPRLAHDLAFLFIRLQHFPSAIAILTRAIPLMLQPVERALAWSSLAWAAGGAGLRDRFHAAERTTLQFAPDHPDFAPAIFIHLAEGARCLGDWERARRYAEVARSSARTAVSPTLEQEAAELVVSVDARNPAPPQSTPDSEIESLTALVLDRVERGSLGANSSTRAGFPMHGVHAPEPNMWPPRPSVSAAAASVVVAVLVLTESTKAPDPSMWPLKKGPVGLRL